MIINPYAFGVAYDPDAQAFFTASGLTGATNLTAINNLVVALKGYGIWTKMKAIYPIIGGTAALHKWNLKDPQDTNAAFRLVFNGGMTHSSTGILFGGVNGYAETFLNSQTVLTASNHHLSLYSRTNNSGNIYDIGSGNFGGSQLISLFLRRSGDLAGYDAGNYLNNRNTFTNTDARGFYNGTTIINTQSKYFKNGILSSTKALTPASLILGPSNIFFGAFNENGATFFSNKEYSFASIGDGLTDTEAANFYTAVQAYNTTLSRQV